MSSRISLLGLALLLVAVSAACACNQSERNADGPVSTSGAPADSGWPRFYEKHGDQVVLYQPQVDSWTNYTNISFRAALAVTPKGKKEPFYGVLAVKATTFVDHDENTVWMNDLDRDVRFVNLSDSETRKLEKMVREVLPKKDYLKVSLDRVLAYMDAGKVKVPQVNVNLNPPPIFRSESPAIMVIFMGPPRLQPIKGTGLMSAVNTNWDVFLDTKSQQYYLRDNDSWLMAPDPLKGPWTAAPNLPADLSKLPRDANWKDVLDHVPGKPAKTIPKVFTSIESAELIVTQGPPEYTPLAGTGLMYVSNPATPLFQDLDDSSFYFLVAGRWFRSKSLDGPWAAASANLPEKFAKIPAGSPVGYVLASVPKTQEAKDAILLASVPVTATINRSSAKVAVVYDGTPQFVEIQGTPMKYAANSAYSVISAGGQFYCCYNGVWFIAPAANGPWIVCASVPSVIYTMPPTCPLYNVTYVRVDSSTPTTVVCEYTSGYSGEYVAATGTLMFGAGMLVGAAMSSNDSYYHYGAAYCSYGCAATYHYGYGGYYHGSGYYGPYGGAGHYAGYNAATGAFSRGAACYGPAGAAGVHQAYNPFTGTYRGHAGATNGYQSWGHSVASRGDQWAESGHVSGERGSAGSVQTSGGRSAEAVHGAGGGTAVKGPQGNVYAGKDGNVYRKPEGGGWEHYGEGGWHGAQGSSGWADHGFQNQMNHDSQSRSWGNELDSRLGQSHSGGFGGFRGGGGFGGGGFRGGGFHGRR